MKFSEICRILADAEIENAVWDASLLAEHFCGIRSDLLRMGSDPDLSSPALLQAVERRAAREPLQYLLGTWQFYRQEYEVSPHCLIPRSDTEILVDAAIRLLPSGARFADLCTGSGCIAISVLAERPDTTAIAAELYDETMKIACRNAVRNGVEKRFSPLRADVLDPLFCPSEKPLDAIFSNPPYIPSGEIDSLEPELAREPRAALDGGGDGLIFYRSILSRAGKWLAPDGFLLLEIGAQQAADVCALGVGAGFVCRSVIKDYGGQDRVVHFSRSLA